MRMIIPKKIMKGVIIKILWQQKIYLEGTKPSDDIVKFHQKTFLPDSGCLNLKRIHVWLLFALACLQRFKCSTHLHYDDLPDPKLKLPNTSTRSNQLVFNWNINNGCHWCFIQQTVLQQHQSKDMYYILCRAYMEVEHPPLACCGGRGFYWEWSGAFFPFYIVSTHRCTRRIDERGH